MAYTLIARDVQNVLTLQPEFDIKESGRKVESRHRTRDGSEYAYRWGAFDEVKFSVKFLTATVRDTLNAWWDENTDLVYLTFKYDLAAASYNSTKYSVAAEVPSYLVAVHLSPDGTKMHASSLFSDIYQYTLSTPYDVSTASYDSVTLDVSSETSSIDVIEFSDSGLSMYILGAGDNTVFQYTLTTPYDISTVSYSSKSFSVATEETNSTGLFINKKGTKMFISGFTTNTVYQYTLSTPDDVSTASYDSISFSLVSQSAGSRGLELSDDGVKMFYLGTTNDTIYQYTLSTPDDVSTASYDSVSFSLASIDTDVRGFTIGMFGSKIYIPGNASSTIYMASIGDAKLMRIVNKKKPVDSVMKPYNDLYAGKVELSTY